MASESKGVPAPPRSETPSAGFAGKFLRPVGECPVQSVTVFVDRAEVTRLFAFDVTEAGQYEAVMEGLPESANLDSLRVKGTGHFVILEVTNDVHYKMVTEGSAETKSQDETDALKSREKAIKDEVDVITEEIALIDKSKSMFDAYATSVLAPAMTPKKPAAGGAGAAGEELTVPDLAFVTQLLDVHGERTRDAARRLREARTRIDALRSELTVIQSQLSARGVVRTVSKASRDATVIINATAPGTVTLQYIYMVSGASWSPSYDARINSVDSTLELTYYGLITQSSGEDWNDAKLVLSTATPSVGGVAPKLPTKHVSFGYEHYPAPPIGGLGMNVQAAMFDAPMAAPSSSARAFGGPGGGGSRLRAPAATVATATVESSGSSAAAFAIPRATTIASDNKPHKVTIAILNLESRFRYYAVPVLEPAAYLQALTVNTSEFTLLASSKVNVFLDNNFVSTTSLQNVSPQESFRSFLGVDNGVKVEYKDQGKNKSTAGMWSKSATVTHKFITTVKNTKNAPIQVTLADILPRSTDSRIKVKVISPDPEVLEAGTKAETARAAGREGDDDAAIGDSGTSDSVAQNETSNNIVWNRRIPPQGKTVINFEYQIEYPQGEDIVIA